MKTQIKQFLRLPLAMMVAVSIGSVAIPSLAFDEADVARVAPRANLISADLSGADLRGRDLQGAILFGANLQGANLQGANLQNAGLSFANLQGANLQGANLQGINLQGTNLQGANLQDANLQGATINLLSITSRLPLFTGRGNDMLRFSLSNEENPTIVVGEPDLRSLESTDLRSATYNSSTKFSDGFYPGQAGMILVP